MEIRRRQFCLTVTAGVATTLIPGRPAEARVIPGVGRFCLWSGVALIIVGMIIGPTPIGIGIAAIGVSGMLSALLIKIFYPGWVSTGGGVSDIAATARGDGPTLGSLGLAE